jgi:hypothetical protein
MMGEVQTAQAPVTEKDREIMLAASKLMEMIEEARKSPLGLYKLCFTPEDGGPLIIKRFHEEWNDAVLKNPNCLICAPRESTKTTFMLAVALWLIGKNVNIRIKWLSENDDLAVKRLATLHTIIDTNRYYSMIFPHVKKTKKNSKRPNNATQLNVERNFVSPEPTVEACGVLSAGTGGRADVIIADDVVGSSNALLNPALKPKVISKFLGDWRQTLTKKGRILYIFTPWASDDLSAHLLKHTTWKKLHYKHGKPGDPYHSIFPERWPREVLIERRREIGEIHYARAYLCQALAEGVIAIDPASLRKYSTVELTRDKLSNAVCFISVDPASGKGAEKGKVDYAGFTVGLVIDGPGDPPYEVFIVENFQVRLTLDMQARLAWQLALEYGAAVILVEAKGNQSLDFHMRNEQQRNVHVSGIDIVPISFGNLSKGQRLTDAVPLLQRPEGDQPMVWFHPKTVAENPVPEVIELDGALHEVYHELREQMLSFPTTHDDAMDSCTQLLNHVRNEYGEGFLANLVHGDSGASRGAFTSIGI